MMLRIPFRFALLILLLTLFCVGLVQAQDATPEATPQPTTKPEATIEATAESTAEATPEANPHFPSTGSFTVHFPTKDATRTYRVTIPRNYDQATGPVPLIIVLHGASGTGKVMEELTGFDRLAEKEGFIVIYPDGINNVWNDGRVGDPRVTTQDDVGFISGTIDFLLSVLKIDPKQIYVTGYSMGAMLSYRLACQLPDKIAAIAPVASTFPEYLVNTCNGTPAVPVHVIQGTDDPIVPWAGVQGGYLSEQQTVAYWSQHNGCQTAQGITMLGDTAPQDGTRVIDDNYTDCTNNADVQFESIFHGGHTWPGHLFDVSIDLGMTSMDIDATQVIWHFFQAHQHS